MSTMIAPYGPIDLVSMLDGHPYPVAAADPLPDTAPTPEVTAAER